MCGGHPPELEMLCDECFGMNADGNLTDENMCPECKENLDRLCFCCGVQKENKEELQDGCCKSCREGDHIDFGEDGWKGIDCGNCWNIDTEQECDCPDPANARRMAGLKELRRK